MGLMIGSEVSSTSASSISLFDGKWVLKTNTDLPC